MKSIYGILILMLVSIYGLAQSIVDTSKTWNNLIKYYMNYQETETIKFTTDTMICGKQYKKVVRSKEAFPSTWTAYGYIREDSSKHVFYRINENDSEKLIYDFTINLYDTINVFGLQNFETGFFFNMDYYVGSIDSIIIGNIYKKKYLMLVSDGGSGFILYGNEWIEGVGGLIGMLHNWNGYFGCDGFELLCYYKNDSLQYQNPNHNSCYVTTSINDDNYPVKIMVFPNPINEIATVEVTGVVSNEAMHLRLFNMKGQLLQETNFNKKCQLDLKTAAPGLYVFVFTIGSIIFEKTIEIY